jgi:phosphoribosyl-AMP cyclohydrolase
MDAKIIEAVFARGGLVPVIIQDVGTLRVLMLGYTNREAFELTVKTQTAWFYSRSRRALWNKGETSGNFLHVRKIYADCDADTLLYLCQPEGPTCPTGEASCFFNEIIEGATRRMIVRLLRNHRTEGGNPPVIVYCSGGSDRSKKGEESRTIIPPKTAIERLWRNSLILFRG